MKLQKFVLAVLVSLVGTMGTLNAQCPGCSITLPADILAVADTIHVDTIEGTPMKGHYYIDTLSFRLPHTMAPLAALDTAGLIPPAIASNNINRFSIKNVTGLPSGLSWVGDRNPLDYTESPPQTRDGCITICGTPAQSGTFEVLIEVELAVEVSPLPDQVDGTTFPLFVTVLPDTNSTFSMDTTAGCDPLEVNFTNNIASGGASGFSYYWDFGNGVTSTSENPDSVIYTAPATTDTTYQIYHRVITDTFPYILKQVIVESSGCTDLLGTPDFYVKLSDGTSEIYNGDYNAGILNNGRDKNAPDTLSLEVNLDPSKIYTMELMDDDPNNFANPTDDACGTFSFSGNNVGTFSFTNGGSTVKVTIEHYIDTLITRDSITICPTCIDPLGLDTTSATPLTGAPQFSAVTFGWTENGPATDWEIEFGTSGFTQGTGSVTSASGTPTATINMGTYTEYDVYVRSKCPSGDSSSWIGPLTFIANDTSNISVKYVNQVEQSLQVFPNPTNDDVTVSFELNAQTSNAQLAIVDVLGRKLYEEEVNASVGSFNRKVALKEYGKGVYLVQLTIGKTIFHRKIIVR
ncbi:MAG: T9SS type A sorting domain-containing protein [Aureispira sp.]|nr:T9SS type A sorting domain-containing protein [Aureispira sp.]